MRSSIDTFSQLPDPQVDLTAGNGGGVTEKFLIDPMGAYHGRSGD
jgi:hypothetical protein